MFNIVYSKYVQPELPHYMGLAFEIICTQYLIKQNKNLSLPFVFGNIGRWWGNNPNKKRQEEIDIVAVDDHNIIYGECKWRNEPIGLKIYNALIEKSMLIKGYENKYYYLFSKSGFTKELVDNADELNLMLVDLETIYDLM